jgi:signal peptidase I
MLPAYRNGTRNLINKLAYWSHEPRRGDVVALRKASGEVWIKRIIGLPGETVELREGKVVINGEPLDEPYINSPIPWSPKPITLEPDEYYVFGDNRATSAFGRVRRDHIIGKVVF